MVWRSMIDGKTVLAVIPARSGSKRCPGKNFRPFRGKPLWEWSVLHAEASKYIDKIRLSRDEDRPPELCTDTATSEDVLRYHLAQDPHDFVVLLQPTSPLRTAADIDLCITMASAYHSPVISVRFDGTKNGAVYVASADWISKHNFSAKGWLPYAMNAKRSLDIDYAEQFE